MKSAVRSRELCRSPFHAFLTRATFAGLLPGLLAGVLGCTAGQGNLGASVLSATGLVTQQQAESLFRVGDSISKSQESFTPEQEYYLGRAVSAKILSQYPPVQSAKLTKYVNTVGTTLVNVANVPVTFSGYRFVIVDSDEINAMAAPSGFIYVTKGFLKTLPDEDALAAVLAHEIGHVVLAHGVNAIANANLFDALSVATKEGVNYAASSAGSPVDLSEVTDMFSESVSGVVDKLLTSGYDRKQEYAADAYAAALLAKAGYDPSALPAVLKVLETKSHTDAGWYATHPKPSDRLDELDDTPKAGATSLAKRSVRDARFKAAVAGL